MPEKKNKKQKNYVTILIIKYFASDAPFFYVLIEAHKFCGLGFQCVCVSVGMDQTIRDAVKHQ